jgi:L-aspartate semialdehyde sulfurtransferase ferredoxin
MEMSIGLTFPGALKDDAILCQLCKNYNIEVIIIEASFSMTAGWAILKVKGEEKEIEKAFEFLKAKNVKLQRIEIKH